MQLAHTAAVVVVAELPPAPTVMSELVVWCLGLPCLTVYNLQYTTHSIQPTVYDPQYTTPQYKTHRYLLTKHSGVRVISSEVNVFAGSALFGTLSVSECCYSVVVFSSWNYNQCTIPFWPYCNLQSV